MHAATLRQILATLWLSAGAASHAAAPFDLDDAGRVDDGKRRFGSTCAAYCHGSEGVGGRAPGFKGNTRFSPDEAYQIISEGRRGQGVMPPWGKVYTPEQIWELVAYLQHLSRQPAP